jgi:hypothetical protein
MRPPNELAIILESRKQLSTIIQKTLFICDFAGVQCYGAPTPGERLDMPKLTNKEEIYELIRKHPEGLDDDDICEITGIEPRQQVQQLCTQLASLNRIRRQSVDKAGKRRKIHNFPMANDEMRTTAMSAHSAHENWRRRLSALVAVTGREEADLLEEALHLLGMKVLDDNHAGQWGSKSSNRKK